MRRLCFGWMVVLWCVGCGDDGTNAADYMNPGPWAVGVTTLSVNDRQVEVWYPVSPQSVTDTALERDAYFIRDWLPQSVNDILDSNPNAPNPPFVTDAYRDVAASDEGPFPLVLFAHGFASYRNQSTFLTTHLATWGFVVASVDYLERGLTTVLELANEMPIENPLDDAELSRAVVDVIASENVRSGSLLQGRVSTDRIAITGHSAGGGTSIAFGGESDVVVYIPLSAGTQPDSMSTLPQTPSLWLTGRIDEIVELDRVQAAFDAASAPKKLVVIDNMGHLGPSDICAIGASGGGVIQIAIDAGLGGLIPDSFRRLGTDGCQEEALSPQAGWGPVRLFVTAELRAAFGLDEPFENLAEQAASATRDATFTFAEEQVAP